MKEIKIPENCEHCQFEQSSMDNDIHFCFLYLEEIKTEKFGDHLEYSKLEECKAVKVTIEENDEKIEQDFKLMSWSIQKLESKIEKLKKQNEILKNSILRANNDLAYLDCDCGFESDSNDFEENLCYRCLSIHRLESSLDQCAEIEGEQ